MLLARAESWVGADADGDVAEARTELLLRYLHCYGPTTSGHFAEWAGMAKADAAERWAVIADRLVVVRTDRGKAAVLEDDLEILSDPPAPAGVRLLPAKDAFLQARDRDLLLPEPAHRKVVFPVLGGPGVVLHEARPAGIWRGATKGASYEVTVTPFHTLSKAAWAEVETEAERLAHVRGRRTASVVRLPVP